MARCIMREVKAGRGSPHGGVFLDISWIKEHLPNAAEHIKRKLPSMYHQFKQLADIDITAVPMEGVLPVSMHEMRCQPAYGHEQEDGSWHEKVGRRRKDE